VSDLPGNVDPTSPPEGHGFKTFFTISFWRSFFNDPVHATSEPMSMPESEKHIKAMVEKAVDAAIAGRVSEPPQGGVVEDDKKSARRLLGEASRHFGCQASIRSRERRLPGGKHLHC
jgi:hypothetical protein